MAQIWLTYEEMGALFDRSASAARDHAIEGGWARRRCSDGLTRVKMPGGSAHHYMISYATAFREVAEAKAGATGTEANPVHRLHRQVAAEVLADVAPSQTVRAGRPAAPGGTLVERRVPREREWPEPVFTSDAAMTGPKWASAVRRMFG
jgi:hypothetical protein